MQSLKTREKPMSTARDDFVTHREALHLLKITTYKLTRLALEGKIETRPTPAGQKYYNAAGYLRRLKAKAAAEAVADELRVVSINALSSTTALPPLIFAINRAEAVLAALDGRRPVAPLSGTLEELIAAARSPKEAPDV
jgi:hypothetical protein